MLSLNLQVLGSKMAPLYPYKFESLKVSSSTQNLVMDALKLEFPRDFKPKTLGKRIDF
mgnify:CR=1 FL=1